MIRFFLFFFSYFRKGKGFLPILWTFIAIWPSIFFFFLRTLSSYCSYSILCNISGCSVLLKYFTFYSGDSGGAAHKKQKSIFCWGVSSIGHLLVCCILVGIKMFLNQKLYCGRHNFYFIDHIDMFITPKWVYGNCVRILCG